MSMSQEPPSPSGSMSARGGMSLTPQQLQQQQQQQQQYQQQQQQQQRMGVQQPRSFGGAGGGVGSGTHTPGGMPGMANYWPSASEIIARSREQSRAASGTTTPSSASRVGSLVHQYQALHQQQQRQWEQMSPARSAGMGRNSRPVRPH